MAAPFWPVSTDRTSWRTALLSLVPLLILGPLAVIFSYHPGWDPQKTTWISPLYSGMAGLSIFAGLAIGIVKKFPRWSYPYPIFTLLMFTFLVTYMVNRTPWDINHEGNILILVIVILIGLFWVIPFLRPFYANLCQDWTLLSYGLFACSLMLLSTQDHDEAPRLSLLVVLPSLIVIFGALLHLRLGSPLYRLVAIVFSSLLGILVWSIPLFEGMLGSWESFLQVLTLFLAIMGILVGLVIAPGLVIMIGHLFKKQAVK